PGATVVVTGCYAEAEPEALRRIEGVAVVVPQHDKGRLADIVEVLTQRSLNQEPSLRRSLNRSSATADRLTQIVPTPTKRSEGVNDPPWRMNDEVNGGPNLFGTSLSRAPNKLGTPPLRAVSEGKLSISGFEGHTRAFLKIQDGCDARCSYCIVPLVRGPVRSRPLEAIQREAERLAANGYREIVLTGIHLGAYGRDTGGRPGLCDVIEGLLDVPGLERIRLSSIEVNEFTDRLLALAADSAKLCPHFHFPLQSGDDEVLKAMNRAYTAAEYLDVLDKVRARIERPSFTTDVMVGFPGEGERHFQNTLDVCRRAGFSRMHIFPFSPRPGTPAATMPNRPTRKDVRAREERLEAVARELALAYKRQFLGQRVNVLVETQRDARTGKLCGYTERYVKVAFDGPDGLKNTIVAVAAKSATPRQIDGERASD
ncbi:MAG: MiaB/RimO family radical SAM methylthiotransferase, partial [Planctomycetes bacterium]|nr:MiaB/RimO family radical SAM methylthiotransferase [Planctomycetota bacterium]